MEEWMPRGESSRRPSAHPHLPVTDNMALCVGTQTDHPGPGLATPQPPGTNQGEGLLFLGTDLAPPSPYLSPSYLPLIWKTWEIPPSYPEGQVAGQARWNSVGGKVDTQTYRTQNRFKGTNPIPKMIFQAGEFSQLPVWSVLCEERWMMTEMFYACPVQCGPHQLPVAMGYLKYGW